ncbi:MAG: response regulator [Candidatus Staskawiczbacteria bacterium]|nr:response regulator [Candidatus Staskawiczbacteria bacterium]
MGNTNKKILIVEDDKDFLFILQESLKKEGFSVIISENGRDGLAKAEKEKPDLIILDILMPAMDGYEVAEKIKEKNISAKVIFLTNLKDLDSMSKALEIIPSDYIIKSDMPVGKIVEEVKKKLEIV